MLVSGKKQAVAISVIIAKKHFEFVKVSEVFHSNYMDPLKEAWDEEAPQQVVSCSPGRPDVAEPDMAAWAKSSFFRLRLLHEGHSGCMVTEVIMVSQVSPQLLHRYHKLA
jgi:hypothetical protein